ncbi:hypothetical protein [Novilysobacter arseniciresistens]|uniref:hypothetical protein n=1 Tax=Novilysobacter arseniciresistens TaxID=1385522 RepID=UPI00126A163D|nr:hypothetical protein [Lysobacter arseniciresistens]
MLTKQDALLAYAKMINVLDVAPLEPLLANDFTYESQTVFSALDSKQAFLDYIRPKLLAIREAGFQIYAEMGTISAYGEKQPCVVLAEGSKDNLVGIVLACVSGDKLSRLDLCIVPPAQCAERTGHYPSTL